MMRRQMITAWVALLLLATISPGYVAAHAETEHKHDESELQISQKEERIISKEYVSQIYALQETDINRYCAEIESLTDDEYAAFAVYLPLVIQEEKDKEYKSETPAIDAQGNEYIKQKYGFSIDSATDDELVKYIHVTEKKDPDAFFDIIANMSDEQYDRYYRMNEYYEENGLFKRITSIDPFTIQEGKIRSGTDILTADAAGPDDLPEHILFAVTYSDGTQTYIYKKNSSLTYIPDNGGIRVIYRDDTELSGECLLTKKQKILFESGEAEGYIYQIPGNLDIDEISQRITTDSSYQAFDKNIKQSLNEGEEYENQEKNSH